MNTFELPFMTVPPVCGFVGASKSGHVCESADALHAGMLPMKTVALPGPGPSGVP